MSGQSDKKKPIYKPHTKVREMVLMLLEDGNWWTLDNLSAKTGRNKSHLASRIRDLRTKKHGSHNIEKRFIGESLCQYRLVKEK